MKELKTIYIQNLLRVLLEEYEDIDYMLETLVAQNPSKKDSAKIRRLLSQLSQQNDKLLTKFES